jgi:poly[(R)-3-hydroxyalkanoate] polymerase subunit PhaC
MILIMSEASTPLFQRVGPRPLGLHIGLANFACMSSVAALPLAREGMLPWISELQSDADKNQADLSRFDLTALVQAMGAVSRENMQSMLSGIGKYHNHPYRRDVLDAPVVWQLGAVTLQDFGENLPKEAPVALLVPSLVNRAYILNLKKDRSFVMALSEAGIRPLLLDWGAPDGVTGQFDLDDYLLHVISPAIHFAHTEFRKAPLHLAGYCMGGTLATAAAEIDQDKLTSLIAIAAPWNFHEGLGTAAKQLLADKSSWQAIIDAFGQMPVDVLQSFFAALDPNLCLQKFAMFNQMDPSSSRAENFVALEDWLNDGTALAGKAAMSCFSDWYGDNKPFLGEWLVNGRNVCPKNITIPSMIAVPKSDKIVPPASALALADQLPNVTVVTPPSGHIGMMVGSSAAEGLWADVIRWIKAI